MPPTFAPFRSLHYALDRFPDLEPLIAPPYDVLSAAKLSALRSRSPVDFTRLTVPDGDGAAKYAAAGELFCRWIADGTLVREAEPVVYAYVQRFTHPTDGQLVERQGVIAAVRLHPFSEGVVLPHERTLSGPKADRLALMRATNADLEPIFGIYPDPDGATDRALAAVRLTEPTMRAIDGDGIEHLVWQIADPAAIGQIGDIGRDAGRVFIVDGHHRYETALAYARERHEADPDLPTDGPLDHILMVLTPMSDPGLVILPTHRAIRNLADFDPAALMAQLAERFDLTRQPDRETALRTLTAHADRPAVLVALGDDLTLASLKLSVDPQTAVQGELPAPVKSLDVTALHSLILEDILGITVAAQAAQSNLSYVKESGEAFDMAASGAAQVVFLMNPTKLDQVAEVALSGAVMPQKSTFFYPKQASGFVLHPLWA